MYNTRHEEYEHPHLNIECQTTKMETSKMICTRRIREKPEIITITPPTR
jgi:hypothetical protein